MGNPFQRLKSLRTNILGGGEGGTTTSIARQTPIELAQESPTSRLNKDPLDFSSLSYPLDLINDVTNGHYMLFYINVQDKTRFPYTRADNGLYVQKRTQKKKVSVGFGEGQVDPGLAKLVPKYVDEEIHEGGGATQGSPSRQGPLDMINYSDAQLLRPSSTKMRRGFSDTETMRSATVRIKESIAIYLPPNVQDNYSTKYSGAETAILGFMAASGGKFLDAYRNNNYKEAAQLFKDTAGGALAEMGKRTAAAALDLITSSEGALELGAKIYGATTNPYMEVLFGGVDLRTFTYNFTFAPRNKKEQDEVKKIIHTFRFYQAPELRNNQSMYMGLPAEFDIHYMYMHEDGKVTAESPTGENTFYNKIATCVLTNVSVDYTPGAVHSHADGSPVQIKMSLNFLETQMITKDFVEAGY